ncbi:MAG TPA: hypothetical protein VL095_02000, partial [Flavisolibacter sp.]|nr:hypothetical protein [Flavisolibacter sp.]
MMNKTVQKSMRLTLSSLLILLLISCNNSNNKPNVSDIKVDVNILRFDKDFFSMDTNRLDQSLNELNRKYPSFLPLYSEFLSPIEPMVKHGGQTYEDAILLYYRIIKPLYDAVQKKYNNLDNVRKDLEKGFKYVKYYYPSFKTPAVVASVESFNPDDPNLVYGTVFYHDTLIIRLQMFMGKDFEQYDPNIYPDYLRRRFNGEFIVPNSIRAIANTIYPDTTESGVLIEQMIERGKQWFLLDKFLPDTPDSLKTGYTKNQTEFIKKNEGNIWGEFLKNTPDPYTVEQERLKNYLSE